ncbi:hypothetical protein BZZ01_07060 [Nostocales cyanobacterium HT-58-2]|nr:hypothetical protein BZZ01_07060 [Nostocales cyanobacterium HT-58-2]
MKRAAVLTAHELKLLPYWQITHSTRTIPSPITEAAPPVIPVHEMPDTNDWSLIIFPCSLLPICINLKVKRYNFLFSCDQTTRVRDAKRSLLKRRGTLTHGVLALQTYTYFFTDAF